MHSPTYTNFSSVFSFIAAFLTQSVCLDDTTVKFEIWDTAGQERYRTITTAYYRGAMGFILMYDITNEESFNAVQDWYEIHSFIQSSDCS